MIMYIQCHSVFIFYTIFLICIKNTVSERIVRQTSESEDNLENQPNKTNQNIPTLPLINYGRKSYYIGNVFKGNFFQSEQFCRYHGMNLVSIDSKEENDFLTHNILQGDLQERFWSSGTKLPDSTKWLWFTTGKSLSFTSWEHDQPDKSAKDDECLVLSVRNKEFKWFNRSCWDNFYFICEVTWRDCRKENRSNIRNMIDIRYGQ